MNFRNRTVLSLPTPRDDTHIHRFGSSASKREHVDPFSGERATRNSSDIDGREKHLMTSVAVASGTEVPRAKEHAQALELAVRQNLPDAEVIRGMLDICKADQEKLQLKLSNALEEADAIENLEEVFALNDRLCSAIDAGIAALERQRSQLQRSRSTEDGPTIEVLVDNEDVFSLICMLRAPNEKKVAAALALMKFAKENVVLRNEIRSSGGMHSFLTLFRTKGSNDALRIVASLAVAYILPSFVVSSQTSASVGLRIMECLRYLARSNPLVQNYNGISQVEMLKAASMGVNVLWVNAIQPLLLLETMKAQPKATAPALRPSSSLRLARTSGKTGWGIFDQGQESNEIRELTESAIALITHIAKASNLSPEDPLDVGYNIVEQVCEVDVARPIAVKEGLLTTLVDWTRSSDIDKVRPAVSALRYLVSINDQYMAGWIHSQVVNEGGIGEIVKLLNESVGHDTRVAVAQMLSALCIAPHTRAAVVEARCVGYLVAMLYEHSAPESEDMVHFAASALLQLAAGSMVRASSLSSNGMELDATTPDRQDTVISEILEGWAHGSFVQIALAHSGKLRSVSVEALRILSEDMNEMRQTRLLLCSAGAGKALGKTLKQDAREIEMLRNPDFSDRAVREPQGLAYSINDVHDALRGIANMLEPLKESSRPVEGLRSDEQSLNPRDMLIKGCVDLVRSGALECILRIVTLPYRSALLSADPNLLSVDRIDLIGEACRLLANLSPLLLSEVAASAGCASCSSAVYDALHSVLVRAENDCDDCAVDLRDLDFNALRGLGALARYEPLKTLIVDKSLPTLLFLNNLSGEKDDDLSNAAGNVLVSLGFIEDETTVQNAGNDPKLLVDWFCLQRSLLLQAMARAELKSMLAGMWKLPFDDIGDEPTLGLIRQTSGQSNVSASDTASDISEQNPVLQGLFENFTRDRETHGIRQAILEQYRNVYSLDGAMTSGVSAKVLDLNGGAESTLLKSYTFPLNNAVTEKEWVLAHSRAMETALHDSSLFCSVGVMPKRVQILLDSCFPSTVLRNHVIPFNDLQMQSSFNFRAFMMPQRRYFSFSREGRLLVRLCERQAGISDTDEIHWSLCFTNSTFAGEFVDSLIQTLYLCPMLTGLSFARSPEWATRSDVAGENETDDGGLLANLAGSLPPWVSHLTFDGVLQDKDLKSLVAILGTTGGTSDLSDDGPYMYEDGSFASVRSNGKFSFIGIRYSPQIMHETWISFFGMLGKTGSAKRGIQSMPLSSLLILDLSGNEMGDELAAKVLELVHGKDSGCNLEQLDLSGNRVGRGMNVVRVLTSYTEYYRYDRKFGKGTRRSGWKSTLHTLVLADNDLFLGQAALEICALLKRDALCLRFLDLSNNGLEGDAYQFLASSLVKNTSLCHLDLSRNKFSPSLIDSILERINAPNVESSLSFLLLENNSPPITARQRQDLGSFLRKSRKNAILRRLKEKKTDLGEAFNASIPNGLEHEGHERITEDDDTFNGSFLRRSRASSIRSFALAPDAPDAANNMITVLFSAPLVFADEANRLHPFAKLDFDMERELLWQCMKEASRDIELSFDSAHHSRLLASLAKRCTCLHYSGHGHPHFLPFEDGMGGPNWFNVANIKKLLVSGEEVPFKFVFVSACHSGLAGETFASAGVPHVVCCQQEKELKDTAALAFTRSFYLALAVGHTVRESFEQGRKAVRATPNLKDPEKEMEKFVLLPRGGNHDVPVFRAKPVPEWPKQIRLSNSEKAKPGRRGGLTKVRSIAALGAKSSELGTRNMIQEDPAPSAPQFFIGREIDMFLVLTALLKMKKRLVNVLGEPGIGRSSLVCGLCHYINERASTITEIDHIYFIKPKHGGRTISCRSLLRQLLDKVKEAGKCRSSEDETEVEGMLEIICKSLKNEKALIVFDRTELLEKSDDAEELPTILSTLLYDTKQVKIVLTGRHSLGQPSIGGQVEHPYELGALNVANSIRLFGHLCPHLHTPSERELFFSELNGACGDCAQLFPGDDSMSERGRNILALVGGGIPAKIEKAAYSISKEALANLRRGKF